MHTYIYTHAHTHIYYTHAMFWGHIPLHGLYIGLGLLYGRYLQFRDLKWLLNLGYAILTKAPWLVENLGATMRPGQAIDLRGRCRFPNLWHIAFDQSRPRILGRFENMGEKMFDSSNGTRFAGHCVVDVWGTLDHEATKQPRLVHRSSVHSFLCLNFPKTIFT